MIATLRFDLCNPDDRVDYIHASEGHKYYEFIQEIKDVLFHAANKATVIDGIVLTPEQIMVIAKINDKFMEHYHDCSLREVKIYD